MLFKTTVLDRGDLSTEEENDNIPFSPNASHNLQSCLNRTNQGMSFVVAGAHITLFRDPCFPITLLLLHLSQNIYKQLPF